MLQSISWSEYWKIMGLGVGVYYSFMLIRYFPSLKFGTTTGVPGDRKGFMPAEEVKEVKKKAPAGKEESKKAELMNGQAVVNTGALIPAAEGAARGEAAVQPGGVVEQPAAVQEPEKLEIGRHKAVLALPVAEIPTPPPSQQLELPLDERPVNLMPVAERVTGEVRGLIAKAGEEKEAEGQLIYRLQQVLDNEEYKILKGSYFEGSINEIIQSELAMKCSIHLDAQRLKGLWVR